MAFAISVCHNTTVGFWLCRDRRGSPWERCWTAISCWEPAGCRCFAAPALAHPGRELALPTAPVPQATRHSHRAAKCSGPTNASPPPSRHGVNLARSSPVRNHRSRGHATDIALLRAALFDQTHHIARARDAARPSLVEVGDQPLETVGLERRIEPRHVGKLIGRVMHAGVCRAPEAPAFSALNSASAIGR